MPCEVSSFLAEKLVAPQYYSIVDYSKWICVNIKDVPASTWEKLLEPFFRKKIDSSPVIGGRIIYYNKGELVRCMVMLMRPEEEVL